MHDGGDDDRPRHDPYRLPGWRSCCAFLLITIPLLALAVVVGGYVGFLLVLIAAALVAAALLDPG